MSRYLIHTTALTTVFGTVILGGGLFSTAHATPRHESLSGGVSHQVTIIRTLEEQQLAQANDPYARDRAASKPIDTQNQGMQDDMMPSREGMRGGRINPEPMREPAAEPMQRERQQYPTEQQSAPSTQERSWWKPWTWGSGMRSQQELQQEQQQLPSSGAAMRNPRYENETVVEQPWRAPDVPGQRGQSSTGRESRVPGGSPAQLNPGTGADYYFGRRPAPGQDAPQGEGME